jgi:hypothetical protein
MIDTSRTDTIPIELDIKLRVNRRDLSLPDSHGQIWMQLVSASEQDPELFSHKRNRNKKALEGTMLDTLCLGNEAKFPLPRLVTLWRNDRWKLMISRWCGTPLGKELFAISLWERLASYRLDDVSYPPFGSWTECMKLTMELISAVLVPCSQSSTSNIGNVARDSYRFRPEVRLG